jgi:hypothetical protein
MEMDLRTSGALSRAHFAVVQQVENAATAQAADLIIKKEISSLKKRLQSASITSVISSPRHPLVTISHLYTLGTSRRMLGRAPLLPVYGEQICPVFHSVLSTARCQTHGGRNQSSRSKDWYV